MKYFSFLLISVFFLGACKDGVEQNPSPTIPFSPAWLSEHQLLVYGSPDLDYLRTIHATGTTWDTFFRGVNDEERAYVNTIQTEGFHLFSNFSTMQGYEYLVPEQGLEERTACLSLNGEKAKVFWSAEEEQPWIPCNNNPEWADSLHQRIAEHANAGVHGVHIDEVEGIAGFLFVAGFCPYCMAGFREHLRENFSPDERRKRFGIDDLDSFDYGAYLRGLDKELEDDPNVELRREFVLFQMLGRKRQIESLVRTAKETGGPDVAISANTTFLSPHKQIFMGTLDLAVYEMFMTAPPEGRYLAMHLWARAIDPTKRFVIFPVSTDMLGLTAEDWTLIAFWMLEALAGGASFLIPYNAYTGYGPRYTVPAEPLEPVGTFLEEFDGLYQTLKPIADVAILYDLSTGLEEFMGGGFAMPIAAGKTDKSFQGIGRALQEAHLPYAVLYVGDGQFVEKMPSTDDLRAYSAIVVPDAPFLRAEMREALSKYQAEGGTVVEVGELGAIYEDESDVAVRDEITSPILSALPSPSLTTNAATEVALVPWRAEDALLVHLLNYGYDKESHSFAEVNNIEVWIRLPAGMESEGKTLALESPWDAQSPLPFEARDNGISFTIPSLSNYLLAVLK